MLPRIAVALALAAAIIAVAPASVTPSLAQLCQRWAQCW